MFPPFPIGLPITMRELRGGSDEQDGVGVDFPFHFVDVDASCFRVHVHVNELDAEAMTRLIKRRVHRTRGDASGREKRWRMKT